MDDSALNNYMSSAIEKLVFNAISSTIRNPKETIFLMKYLFAGRKANRKRAESESFGLHIPAFLICSITTSCNLFCTGCYARANKICCENKPEEILSNKRWAEIFMEAQDIGISFILLAGGEPLLNREIIKQAARSKNVIFPIFTNGTILDEVYIELFKNNRNLIPVVSLEGDENRTDSRRGAGTHSKIENTLKKLKDIKVLYGISITMTGENLEEVSSDDFIAHLHKKGCRIVFFIEYVPIADDTEHLTLKDKEREFLDERQNKLRLQFKDIIFLSFPGDEKFMGGCLAAGRGFFHVNPYGKAEPCPFSPYSDIDLKTDNLINALQSPLFAEIKNLNLIAGEHNGGCSLFEHDDQIKELMDSSMIK